MFSPSWLELVGLELEANVAVRDELVLLVGDVLVGSIENKCGRDSDGSAGFGFGSSAAWVGNKPDPQLGSPRGLIHEYVRDAS